MIIKYLFICIALFILEIIYIRIALAKNIKDNPNHRSAHTQPTIRGGGIIIILSIFLYALIFFPGMEFLPFIIAITLVSLISFIDDLIMLSSKIRMIFHLIAITILFYQLQLLTFDSTIAFFLIPAYYIFSIGFLNIYNFMDGINGITFLNALATYGTLLYLNEEYMQFTDTQLLLTLIIAVMVFGFFNFRKKAVCFAGDIGSIAIGFSILYFVFELYIKSQNPLVLFVLAVYLIDGGWTIVQRFLKKENIFEAHKQHLYQLLANDLKISHLKVSTYYFIFQLLINALLVVCIKMNWIGFDTIIIVFLVLTVGYITIKRAVKNKINQNNAT